MLVISLDAWLLGWFELVWSCSDYFAFWCCVRKDQILPEIAVGFPLCIMPRSDSVDTSCFKVGDGDKVLKPRTRTVLVVRQPTNISTTSLPFPHFVRELLMWCLYLVFYVHKARATCSTAIRLKYDWTMMKALIRNGWHKVVRAKTPSESDRLIQTFLGGSQCISTVTILTRSLAEAIILTPSGEDHLNSFEHVWIVNWGPLLSI